MGVGDAVPSSPHPTWVSVQADFIMRGLAEVGIVALVDEATGHIEEKRKDEYRELFQEFIRQIIFTACMCNLAGDGDEGIASFAR